MSILAKCSACSEPFERLFKFCPNCGLSVTGEGFADKNAIAVHDLFDLAGSLASINDLDLLLKRISYAAEKLTQSEASAVMLLDESKEYLYFKMAGGEKEGVIKTIKIPVGQGIGGWVAEHGKPLLIEDVAKDSRFSATLADQKTGFQTKSILCVPLMLSNEVIGVMEVLNKKSNVGNAKFTKEDQEILGSLAGFATVAIVNSRLNTDQKNFFANMIEILTSAVETGTRNPQGHCWRVAQMSCAIAKQLKISGRPYRTIYYASFLHDIGYITAQRQLLLKNIPISQSKLEAMHPTAGAETVETINLLKDAAPLIRAHHENWDGSGFPDNLKGEEIPLGARIIGFVEAIEDLRNPLISEETYKTQIQQFASQNVNRLFDPKVVAAYLAEISKEATV
jgi:HD-GYP domain-containing protein (c-di-GMP phosphodiesterase class II)